MQYVSGTKKTRALQTGSVLLQTGVPQLKEGVIT